MRRMGQFDRKVEFQDADFGLLRSVPPGLARPPCSCSQPLVREHLAVPVRDHLLHLVQGAHASKFGASSDFVQVPFQVLKCHALLDSVTATLKK